MTPAVAIVSRPMPTFAAQQMMDVSFLWQRTVDRRTLDKHYASMRNLNRDGSIHTGDQYTRADQGLLALATHLLWAVATYVAAWFTLKARERR